MPASRNPFFIRTAEQSESDDQFLSLFSLSVLDLLPEDGSWNRLLPIELPPGAGKSTLLRLFTPTVLTSIANRRHQSDVAELADKLSRLDVIDANGVQLLGVLVNCKDDFNRLADLFLDQKAQQLLFWALLHSRLALLTMRAVLQLNGLIYPKDVNLVYLEPRPDGVFRRPDARTISGKDLFERAREAEQNIVDSLNRFVPGAYSVDDNSSVDDFFQLLNTHRILIEGGKTTKHLLLMFDDAHMLDETQRSALVLELRRHDQSAFASWMASRLRALTPPELISEVAHPNREGFTPLTFEKWSPQRMVTWLMEVGDRRAQRAQRDVSSFRACLSNSLETEFIPAVFEKAAESERTRTYDLAEPYGALYGHWLEYWEKRVADLPPVERAIRWAQLQILMHRRIQSRQGEMVFGPLPTAYIEGSRTDTLDMANVFMAERNGLPYFFGAEKVAQLASSNVDQFLALSAALFDLLLDGGYLGRRHLRELPPSAQHRLIVQESEKYVVGLRTSLPYGYDVFNLVAGIAGLCHEQSWRPNVPVTPGVTGISLQAHERDALVQGAGPPGTAEGRLVNALASAVAHNVLVPRPSEGRQDGDRAIFYLNRLACPFFRLPLGFGGYNQRRVSHLLDWMMGALPSHQLGLDVGLPT